MHSAILKELRKRETKRNSRTKQQNYLKNFNIMEGLFFEYVIDYLNEDDHQHKKQQEQAPQKSHQLISSLKDLIKKLAKPKQ